MRIGIYITNRHAKEAYKNDCYDARINAGISVVADILRRNGYTDIEYCSSATVQRYDVILYSVTSDCDWWGFLGERILWEPGDYKVCVGGAGVLNVRPFLPYIDYAMLGRGEGVVEKLIRGAG